MRIIQTFWTIDKNKNPFDNSGGFLSPTVHWMMWALSCQKFKEFHNGVTIYTDEAGKYVFEKLNLPFANIELTHETGFMQSVNPKLWAMSKIYTYSLQTEPFMHVDGDVAIWEKLPSRLLKADVASQCLEFDWSIYSECVEDFKKIAGNDSPDWILNSVENPSGYNMGLFGGKNINFINAYASSALDFYEKYSDELSKLIEINRNANVLPEQYFLYDRVVRSKAKMEMLAPEPMLKPLELSEYTNVSAIPSKSKFFHAIGGTKKSPIVNDFISYALKKDYPELWNQVASVCDRELASRHHYLFSKAERPSDYEYSDYKQGIKTLSEIANHTAYDCSDVLNNYCALISRQKEFRLNSQNDMHQNCIFPTYKKRSVEVSSWRNRNKIVFLSDNLEVFATNYDWRKIFMETSMGNVCPVPYLLGDLNYRCCFTGSWNHFWIDDFMWEMIEDMRQHPYSVKQLIGKYSNNRQTRKMVVTILNILYYRGVFSLKDDAQNFVPTPLSADYVRLKKNRERQVESVVQYILKSRKTRYDGNLKIEKGIDGQVSLKTIIDALAGYGVMAKGVKATMESLEKLNFPIIALLKIRDVLLQYVVLKKVENNLVTIYNAEIGADEVYSIEHFKTMWNGVLIV